MELAFELSPYLKLPRDETIWKKQQPKEGVSWWAVDTDHLFFNEGKPYYGLVHCEILGQRDEDVFNLSIERGDGVKVFSFGFPSEKEEMRVFIDTDKADHRKALRVAYELLHHLPESEVKTRLWQKVSKQCSLLEFTTPQKIWDKV